jgi:hypothetical protein
MYVCIDVFSHCGEVNIFVCSARNVIFYDGKIQEIWFPEQNFAGAPGQSYLKPMKPG